MRPMVLSVVPQPMKFLQQKTLKYPLGTNQCERTQATPISFKKKQIDYESRDVIYNLTFADRYFYQQDGGGVGEVQTV